MSVPFTWESQSRAFMGLIGLQIKKIQTYLFFAFPLKIPFKCFSFEILDSSLIQVAE